VETLSGRDERAGAGARVPAQPADDPAGVWTVTVVVPRHPGGVVGMAVSSSTLSELSGVLASKPLDSPGDSALPSLSLYWPSPVRWLNLAVEGTHDFCVSSVEIGKPVPDP
jgi:hypothetical protein